MYLQAELVVQSLYVRDGGEDKSAPDVSPAIADELLTSSLGNYQYQDQPVEYVCCQLDGNCDDSIHDYLYLMIST